MQDASQSVSTVEVIRAAWPIVVAMIGAVIWLARLSFMAHQNKQDFKDFKEKEYAKDQSEVVNAVKELRDSQKASEEKLEEKLDAISLRHDVQLNKVYEEINKSNILLAKMEGQLSNLRLMDKN